NCNENADLLRTTFTTMKTLPAFLLAAFAVAGVHHQAQAQERVWRCGNEYTNNATVAQQRGCKVMEGGNVTVVQGTRPAAASAAPGSSAARAPAGSPRVDSADQRARDGEARSVLQS